LLGAWVSARGSDSGGARSLASIEASPCVLSLPGRLTSLYGDVKACTTRSAKEGDLAFVLGDGALMLSRILSADTDSFLCLGGNVDVAWNGEEDLGVGFPVAPVVEVEKGDAGGWAAVALGVAGGKV